MLTAIESPTSSPATSRCTCRCPRSCRRATSPTRCSRNEARGFFKDQRAHKIGDILTVIVTIDDQAQISNADRRTRSSTNEAGFGGVARLALQHQAAPGVDPSIEHLDLGHQRQRHRLGQPLGEPRDPVAAVVTQVLPNGNLVIEGRQEVRVNFEVRDLIVAGIVRPEDIGADNTIPSAKIAEARIAYGGRGQITDVQQPRYGQQIARRHPALLGSSFQPRIPPSARLVSPAGSRRSLPDRGAVSPAAPLPLSSRECETAGPDA